MDSEADSSGPEPGTFEDGWRERFRDFAESRDDDAGIAGWSASGLGARLRRFRGLWNSPRDRGLWLDAGCGAGTYTRVLEEGGQRVIGVDYSFPALRKAAARSQGGCQYVVADVRRLPFRQGSFDGILCFGVMQALADSEPALRELAASVRPGGEVWVDALNRGCVVNAAIIVQRRLRGRPMHLRYESPRKIARILRNLRFEDVQLHWMPIVPANWPRLQRWLERPLARKMMAILPSAGLLFSHAFIVSARRSLLPPQPLPPE